jgi:selenocysteine-specific elongation factor
MGFEAIGLRVGEWVVDPQWWAERRQQMMTAVQRWAADHDVAAGMSLEALRRQAGLPAAELLSSLLDGTGLDVADGLVRPPNKGMPPRVEKAVRAVEEWLAAEPFRAPEADELKDLNLGPKELAAAVRTGRLTRIADGVVLGPDALDRAADVLKALPQPFTVADAKRALGTTRRVAVPLLEQLDARRITRRADDNTRTVV